MKEDSSRIFKTERSLMFMETEMKKEEMSLSGRDMEVPTRDGESSMLTKQERPKPRDLTETSDSTSIDHSTSDQECQ
jgi:hypothetical protein